MSGLSLDASEEDLALLYLAAVQSIAYGTRHIVEHCNAHGLKVLFPHGNCYTCHDCCHYSLVIISGSFIMEECILFDN